LENRLHYRRSMTRGAFAGIAAFFMNFGRERKLKKKKKKKKKGHFHQPNSTHFGKSEVLFFGEKSLDYLFLVQVLSFSSALY